MLCMSNPGALAGATGDQVLTNATAGGPEDSAKLAKPATPIRLSGSWTASAAGVTVNYEGRRRGSPICALARKLLEAGHDPATILHIYRGGTLCFEPRPLGLWAGLTVEEGDNSHRPARLAKYRPPGPRLRTAQSGVGSGGFTGLPDVSGSRGPGDADAALATGGAP